MKSITIHNLDEALANRLKEEARRRKQSVNRTIKEILSRAFQGEASAIDSNFDKKGFRKFLGLWTPEEGERIQKAIEEFEVVDDRDWRESPQ